MLRSRENGGQNGYKRRLKSTHAPVQESGEKWGAQVAQTAQEPPGHVAGGGRGVPSCGRTEGAEASMWIGWLQCVQDDDMAGGETVGGWMGSRTRTGLVWQKQICRAKRDPIGQGERGVYGRSGTS
jgi:hypothetical protein